MRPAIAAVVGNCIFGTGLRDAWAVFEVPTETYDFLRDDQKIARLAALAGALEVAQGDLQLLRIADTRPRATATRMPDVDRELAIARRSYLRAQEARVEAASWSGTPRLFLVVSIRNADARTARIAHRVPLTARGWNPLVAATARTSMTARRLEEVQVLAERVRQRITEHVSIAPATSEVIQWIVRRAYCRGLGEPEVDPFHDPTSVVYERNGEATLTSLDGEWSTWQECHVEQQLRELVVHSELGSAHQATLIFGALPESFDFPTAALELMFRPAERLDFPVDVSLTARYLSNAMAVRLARTRLQDADQIVRAEADGEQGATDLGIRRSELARRLLAELQSGALPPLFRSTIAVAVAAQGAEQLDDRIDACRRAFAPVTLHRPVADQLRAFSHHIPAQRSRTQGYAQVLTARQLAALMPTASEQVGSLAGFYLGHTLTASRRAVRFNLSDGSEGDQNTAIFCVGALGTGKTTLAQKLCYEALLQGARVVDCDPKGDHRLHLLDEVASRAELLAVRPERSLRGLLDPLRVAPPDLRHEAALAFLRSILPSGRESEWESTLLRAVDRVISASPNPTCFEVIREVKAAGATDLAETLEVHARSGLTQLAFADPDVSLPSVGERPYTYIAIRDLPGPPIGTPRSQYSHSERVGEQIVRLVALLSMHLMAKERARLKIYAFDEGWRLLGDPVGRALLIGLHRMGRSELAVPIISTQLVGDALMGGNDSLENLIGSAYVFGMRSEGEASRALQLLGLDADARSVQRLLAMRAGRCMFRDHRGRVAAIQIDVVPESLRDALSTTPSHA